MSTELSPRALTSVKRIKDRIDIDNASLDTLIERLINGVSDHLESLCNRKFLEATYTNEVYSVHAHGIQMLALNQMPVTALTSLQYRAGTPAVPTYTSFTTNEYELMNDGKSGLIRIYSGTRYGVNTLRATYTAGYKIDFTATNDTTKHTLPFDLSDLAERLVTKRLKKRSHEGKLNESFDGGTVTWDAFIDKDDAVIVGRYTRLPAFI